MTGGKSLERRPDRRNGVLAVTGTGQRDVPAPARTPWTRDSKEPYSIPIPVPVTARQAQDRKRRRGYTRPAPTGATPTPTQLTPGRQRRAIPGDRARSRSSTATRHTTPATAARWANPGVPDNARNARTAWPAEGNSQRPDSHEHACRDLDSRGLRNRSRTATQIRRRRQPLASDGVGGHRSTDRSRYAGWRAVACDGHSAGGLIPFWHCDRT